MEKNKDYGENSDHQSDIPFINLNIHRIGRSDTFGCYKCPKTGDKHYGAAFLQDNLTVPISQLSKELSTIIDGFCQYPFNSRRKTMWF